MKFTPKTYQRDAVREVLIQLRKAQRRWRQDTELSAFALSAVTGAGKTVMAAYTFEALFYGDEELAFERDPGAVVIWFSDDPSLNEQTRYRIMEASDRINPSNLVVVEPTFNRPKFEAGRIYFLNTQKLGKNSLLTRGANQSELEEKAGELLPETRPDLRAYTIWDTIKNTIEDPELTLYLVLDEAHRGMAQPTAAIAKEKGTIVQRLINGANGIPPVPVVWGISATVQRFNDAMESRANRTMLSPIQVSTEQVKESGLIKDAILLAIPDKSGDFDAVLLRRATDKLAESTKAWDAYCAAQSDVEKVVPLLVLQVPNTPDPDQIGRALDVVLDAYSDLKPNQIAHVFGGHTDRIFGRFVVPYIAPQDVQDKEWVRVLIAKDAISTGWDCPRAEVMVSFRPASDETHITQLLGRMVRSPLARRIPNNDKLNSVECLLPRFNKATAEKVVNALITGDGSGSTTGRVLLEYVDTAPNPAVPQLVWNLFAQLPSQTRPQKGAKPVRRLSSLALELSADGLLPGAAHQMNQHLFAMLDQFQADHAAKIAAKRHEVLHVDGTTIKADLLGQGKSLHQFQEDADLAAIDDSYRLACNVFSADLAGAYVQHLALKLAGENADQDALLEAVVDAKVTVAGLGLMIEVADAFDTSADELATAWLAAYQSQITSLTDVRQDAYRQITAMSSEPQDVALEAPTAGVEPTVRLENGSIVPLHTWSNHLMSTNHGVFPADLNQWEQQVVQTELSRASSTFWYRNPQQAGLSSLGIAYQNGKDVQMIRPDFVFFAKEGDAYTPDIIDPHGAHLGDAAAKLKGLATYAASHGARYRRIESVNAVQGHLRTLNLKRTDVQAAIAGAHTSAEVEALFGSVLADDYK